jgi:hypothetical protein
MMHAKSVGVWAHVSYTVLAVAMLGVARPASACSIATPDPVLRGAPAADAEGVPTDVVPVYDVTRLGLSDLQNLPEGFFALHAVNGEEVPLSVERVAAWHVALRPASELSPNTSYVIEAHPPQTNGAAGEPLTLTFTTGAGRLAGAPERPAVFAQHFALAPGVEWTSCDIDEGICFALPEHALYEMSLVGDYVGEDTYLIDAPFANGWGGVTGLECFDFRERALNGTFSEPTRICLDDIPNFELAGDASMNCTEQGIVHAGEPVSSMGDGQIPLSEGGASGNDTHGTPPEASGPATANAGTRVPGGGGASGGPAAQDRATPEASDPRTNDGIGCSLRRSPGSGAGAAALALALGAWTARRGHGKRGQPRGRVRSRRS